MNLRRLPLTRLSHCRWDLTLTLSLGFVALGQTTGSTGGGLPFSNYQASLGLNYIVETAGVFEGVGEIIPFAGSFTPGSWLPADGRSLNTADYPALFDRIGTTYGSAGPGTFKLPDLRGRTIFGVGAS